MAPNRIRRRFNTAIPHQKITTDTSEFKYYNEQRIKEKLGWKSPVQYRIFRLTA
ncbi:IS3 family transposase [uncultured Megasphaera sp.]|uniref:IS3 family transposase n=1 Tax=uncultured Megasphaera sp. TaxID=165188 RepID=UPI00345DA2B0